MEFKPKTLQPEVQLVPSSWAEPLLQETFHTPNVIHNDPSGRSSSRSRLCDKEGGGHLPPQGPPPASSLALLLVNNKETCLACPDFWQSLGYFSSPRIFPGKQAELASSAQIVFPPLSRAALLTHRDGGDHGWACCEPPPRLPTLALISHPRFLLLAGSPPAYVGFKIA